MKDAADKRRELERQHAEALAQLREQQATLSDTSRKASVEVVEALQVSSSSRRLGSRTRNTGGNAHSL